MNSDNTSNANNTAPAPAAQPVPANNYGEPLVQVDASPVNGKASSGQAQTVSLPVSMAAYRSDLYIGSGRFDDEIKAFASLPKVNTGYSNLDAHQRLYPGVYMLGALTSLGKTTFLYQMGDQIAEAGTPVLYFSLEQSPLEMTTKSMSRKIFLHSLEDDTYHNFSSIEIRDGLASGTRELIEQEGNYYCHIKGCMTIVKGRDMTVEQIASYVKDFSVKYDVKPVVMVDYLQHIEPSFENPGSPKRREGRDQIDHAMKTLKHMQEELSLIVIVISSLNRMNYLTPIDFESFKESGGIEYNADAVWGLQLQIIHNDEFNKKDNVGKKRDLVNMAKSEQPRKIEFVCLKNRSGQPV